MAVSLLLIRVFFFVLTVGFVGLCLFAVYRASLILTERLSSAEPRKSIGPMSKTQKTPKSVEAASVDSFPNTPPPMVPRRSSRYGTLRDNGVRTIIGTVFGISMFNLSLVFALLRVAVLNTLLGWSKKPSTKYQKLVDKPLIIILGTLAWFFAICGYLSMLSIMTSRLNLIFQDTQYSISPSTVRNAKWTIVGLCLSVLVILVVWPLRLGWLTILVTVPTLLIYAGMSYWVSRRFVITTHKIAQGLGSEQRASDLLGASLRLCIVTLTAVFSTLITVGTFIGRIATENHIAFDYTFGAAFVIDSLVNSYCLLFTLSGGQNLYRRVFGWFHDFVLSRFQL